MLTIKQVIPPGYDTLRWCLFNGTVLLCFNKSLTDVVREKRRIEQGTEQVYERHGHKPSLPAAYRQMSETLIPKPAAGEIQEMLYGRAEKQRESFDRMRERHDGSSR